MNAREEFWNQGCYKISNQWKHFKYCTYTKELVLHTISVVQSHYLCTVLLWMNGLRKMFENHWFRDALMWICNDLCIFLSFFFFHGVASSSRFQRAFFLFWTRQFHLSLQISSVLRALLFMNVCFWLFSTELK